METCGNRLFASPKRIINDLMLPETLRKIEILVYITLQRRPVFFGVSLVSVILYSKDFLVNLDC